METYLSDQAIAFLWSVVLGCALGAVYDWFRIGRILKRKHRVTVFFEDLFFSLVAALFTAVSFTYTNYGRVRLFLLVGEGLGFLLYYNTIGVLVGKQARLVARILRRVKGVASRFGRFYHKKHKKIMNILKKAFIFLKERCRMILYHVLRRKCRVERQKDRKGE